MKICIQVWIRLFACLTNCFKQSSHLSWARWEKLGKTEQLKKNTAKATCSHKRLSASLSNMSIQKIFLKNAHIYTLLSRYYLHLTCLQSWFKHLTGEIMVLGYTGRSVSTNMLRGYHDWLNWTDSHFTLPQCRVLSMGNCSSSGAGAAAGMKSASL